MKSQDLLLASWRPRGADGGSFSLSPSLKSGENQCRSLKTVRKKRESFFLLCFLLTIEDLRRLDGFTKVREGHLLYVTH